MSHPTTSCNAIRGELAQCVRHAGPRAPEAQPRLPSDVDSAGGNGSRAGVDICGPETVHLTQVLHQIQQRPLGTGRRLHSEARPRTGPRRGRRFDRSSIGCSRSGKSRAFPAPSTPVLLATARDFHDGRGGRAGRTAHPRMTRCSRSHARPPPKSPDLDPVRPTPSKIGTTPATKESRGRLLVPRQPAQRGKLADRVLVDDVASKLRSTSPAGRLQPCRLGPLDMPSTRQTQVFRLSVRAFRHSRTRITNADPSTADEPIRYWVFCARLRVDSGLR